MGFLIVTTSQDTSYYEVSEPDEKMIQKLKQFLMENSFKYEEKDLKKYLYTEHSY